MAVTAGPPAEPTVEVVLVLRALGLGDLLTAVPALRALRREYPNRRIVLAAPAELAELMPAIGAIDAVLPTSGLVPLDWDAPPPELAVNLHGRGPESTAVLRAIVPQRLYGHRHDGGRDRCRDFRGDFCGPRWDPELHEVDRWCRLLEYYGIAADRTDIALGEVTSGNPVPGAAVVHPGASHAARRWPVARFAAVARWLADRGHTVAVTGNAAERSIAERVARQAGLPADVVLAGHTGLGELASLVRGASLVISGDTGIAHLATGYGTPSVVLFGPVSPRLWGPPADRPQHVALWAGHTGDTFAPRADPGLLRITVDQVSAAASLLLKGGVVSVR